MADALSGFRPKARRVAEMANAVKRLHNTGIIDFADLGALTEIHGSRDSA